MPFFYSISLFCSVMGFHWLNGNHFHGYLNAVCWPVGEEWWCVLRAWWATCQAGLRKVTILFISRSGRAGAASAQAPCWCLSNGSSRWRQETSESAQTSRRPKSDEASPWPERVTLSPIRELCRSVRWDHSVPSKSHVGEREQCFWVMWACVPFQVFPLHPSCTTLWQIKLCFNIYGCWTGRATSPPRKFSRINEISCSLFSKYFWGHQLLSR